MMRDTCGADEVRQWLQGRDVGSQFSIKQVQTETQEHNGVVGPTLSKAMRQGHLRRLGRGNYEVLPLIRELELNGWKRPKRGAMPVGMKKPRGKATTSQVMQVRQQFKLQELSSKFNALKNSILDLGIQLEELQEHTQQLDLSNIPELELHRELEQRREAEGKVVSPAFLPKALRHNDI